MGRRPALVSLGALALVLGAVIPLASALPPAGDELRAAALVDVEAVQQALGEAVTGPEDDGGVPIATEAGLAFLSTARLLSQSGLLYTIELRSFTDEDTAAKYLTTQPDGAVQRGAQVLQVSEVETGPALAALERQKLETGDASELALAFAQTVSTLTPVLAERMTGAPAVGDLVGIPSGAKDPCVNAAIVADEVFGTTGSTARNVSSDSPPALTCRLDVGGLTVELSVVTDEQLAAAVEPDTVANRFSTNLVEHDERGGTTEVPGVGVQAFTATVPEVIAQARMLDAARRAMLVTALVPGSFPRPGQEHAVAALLAQLVGRVGPAFDEPQRVTGLPTTVADSNPDPTRTRRPRQPPRRRPARVATTAAVTPTAATTLPEAERDREAGGSAAVWMVVVLLLVGVGVLAVVIGRRMAVARRPSVVGRPGEGMQTITLRGPTISVGVRGEPGPGEQSIRIEVDA